MNDHRATHPVWRAVQSQCEPLLEALLEAHPTLPLSPYPRAKTLEAALAHCVQTSWQPGVRVLLAQGADLNALNERGQMALHEAARAGKAGMVRELVYHGAALEGLNKWYRTPLGEVLLAQTVVLGDQTPQPGPLNCSKYPHILWPSRMAPLPHTLTPAARWCR